MPVAKCWWRDVRALKLLNPQNLLNLLIKPNEPNLPRC